VGIRFGLCGRICDSNYLLPDFQTQIKKEEIDRKSALKISKDSKSKPDSLSIRLFYIFKNL